MLQKQTPHSTIRKSIMLGSMTLEQLLVILQSERDKLASLLSPEVNVENQHRHIEEINTGIKVIIEELNGRLAPFKCIISFDGEPAQAVDNFRFSFLNPLDSVPVKHIVGAEIFGTFIHLQIVDENGNKSMRKVLHNAFIQNQIEQFRISVAKHQ